MREFRLYKHFTYMTITGYIVVIISVVIIIIYLQIPKSLGFLYLLITGIFLANWLSFVDYYHRIMSNHRVMSKHVIMNNRPPRLLDLTPLILHYPDTIRNVMSFSNNILIPIQPPQSWWSYITNLFGPFIVEQEIRGIYDLLISPKSPIPFFHTNVWLPLINKLDRRGRQEKLFKICDKCPNGTWIRVFYYEKFYDLDLTPSQMSLLKILYLLFPNTY